MVLTEEQLKLIEQKRIEAIDRYKKKLIEKNRQKAIEIRKNKELEKQKNIKNLNNDFVLNSNLNNPNKNNDNFSVNLIKDKKTVTNLNQNTILLNDNTSWNFITPLKRPLEDREFLCKKYKSHEKNLKSPIDEIMKNTIPTINLEFKLLNNREFYVSFKFHQELINEIKKIKNFVYSREKNVWIGPLDDFKFIVKSLGQIKVDKLNIKLGDGFPDEVIQILQDSRKYDLIQVDLESKLPSNVLNKLYEFQKEAIVFGVKREGRILLADDMGLGKTIQSIILSLYYIEDWPLLIVCPSSVKFQWVEAILKWVPNIKESDIYIVDCKKVEGLGKYQVLISSYNSMHKVNLFVKDNVKCAILDESHMIKNTQSQRTKILSKLLNKSKRLILLSGTPAMSRPIELFSQLKMLMPKVFSNKSKFGYRYCDGKVDRYGMNFRGCSKADELKVILESTIMLRRLKTNVLSQLPSKRKKKVTLNLNISSKDKTELEKFLNFFNKGVQKSLENENFLKAFIKTAEIKLEAVIEYLKDIIEKECKFICFVHHKTLLDGLSKFFQERKVTFVQIDGSTSSIMRQKCCEYFQNNVNCKIALLSITAAGTGLTLTSAQMVIFAELYYNPGILIQAEDRAHRIGQKDSVLIEYLIAPGTADDHLWPLITKKVEVLDKMGLTVGDFAK